jgi:hypothetical protein
MVWALLPSTFHRLMVKNVRLLSNTQLSGDVKPTASGDSWWTFPTGTPLRDQQICYQSAVAMRVGARLAGAKLTRLPRSGSAGRAPNGEYLLWAEFFCHTKLHGSGKPHLGGLRPPDNGHGTILQKGAD